VREFDVFGYPMVRDRQTDSFIVVMAPHRGVAAAAAAAANAQGPVPQ
jgi:hypothetical protein